MKHAKIICLMNQKGGVGKSTLAVNIGVELSKLYKTMLIDCDPQGSCNDFSNQRGKVLGERDDLTVCSKIFRRKESKNKVESNEIFAKRIRDGIKHFIEDYEIIILDSPGADGLLSRALASVSDLVIVPITPGFFDAWGTDDTFEAIGNLMGIIDGLKGYAVINQHRKRTILSNHLEDFSREIPIPVFKSTLGAREIYRQSASGLNVVEMDNRSEAAREIENLVYEIENVLGIEPTAV